MGTRKAEALSPGAIARSRWNLRRRCPPTGASRPYGSGRDLFGGRRCAGHHSGKAIRRVGAARTCGAPCQPPGTSRLAPSCPRFGAALSPAARSLVSQIATPVEMHERGWWLKLRHQSNCRTVVGGTNCATCQFARQTWVGQFVPPISRAQPARPATARGPCRGPGNRGGEKVAVLDSFSAPRGAAAVAPAGAQRLASEGDQGALTVR